MRELSVCQGLVAQVLQVAEEQGAERVARIVLQVGALSGVEPSLLADAFPFVSAGTPAEGAELIIETTPVRVHCRVCGADTEARPNRLACSVCGDSHTQVLSGDEFLVTRVELVSPAVAVVRH
jgi:hydrogenase nickel incorporation protein HypA/HybF